ncbi:hypothetical protein FRB97_004425, partial [Tulasnella sp. 331]
NGGVLTSPPIKRLVLSLSGGSELDHVAEAVAFTPVEEIALLLLDRSVPILPRLLRALLVNCTHLRRIILAPLLESTRKDESPNGSGWGGGLPSSVQGAGG